MVVFSGSLDGHLRAYSTRDGAVLWDVDTIRSYDTVNGVKASGGIREAKIALAMIEAGATRLGTSSGVSIVKGLASPTGY